MHKLLQNLNAARHGFRPINTDSLSLVLVRHWTSRLISSALQRETDIFIWNVLKVKRRRKRNNGGYENSEVSKHFLRLTQSLTLPGCRVFQHLSRATSALTGIVCEEESYHQWIYTRLGLPTVPSVASCFAAGILWRMQKKLTLNLICVIAKSRMGWLI